MKTNIINAGVYATSTRQSLQAHLTGADAMTAILLLQAIEKAAALELLINQIIQAEG